MGNISTKLKMLAKMKAVMVKTPNVLDNVNNFLSMRQQGVKSIRLYLGRLTGMARHCNFNLPAGQTSYTDKIIPHILVQGLEDAAIAKDVMEEYADNENLQKHISLENIQKLVKAKENTKRSMTELSRTQEEPQGRP